MSGTRIAKNKAVGAVAATVSAAALACGVCCVLPFALPAAMLGVLGGSLAWFSIAYAWLTPVALAAVIAGWAWVVFQSHRTRLKPARSTLATMAFATAVMSLAWLWPTIEPYAFVLIR